MPLTHTSSRVLEFDSLRDLLRGYAASPLGQARIGQLSPSADRDWIENQHQLTTEIREFRRVGGSFDFSGLLDASAQVEKSRITGAALEIAEIRDVILVVDRAAEWRQIALNPPAAMKIPWKAAAELSSNIADLTILLRFFRNKILPDGTLDDRASPELARVRREVEKQRRAIQDSLRHYLRHLAEGGTVQDEVVTIRGERFVIPVKVEQKRRVQGVVHGASSSGQTVFVEPLETIEQNNELVRLLEEEQAETHRILLEMTSRISEYAEAIIAALDTLREIELHFAEARFAEDYNCVPVGFAAAANERQLILQKARHPLLERNLKLKGGHIVPISVELQGEQKELIITGPNTGGKTVALKTIGMLVLMAQAGLPVPA
ncbi:MAG: endonuclease MutS2, partial [Acidobacteriaceae bacterium]|nr:endonuclease MutS2 [Acidobacteriaceae bacterium]